MNASGLASDRASRYVPALPATFRELLFLIRSDFFRYDGARGLIACGAAYLAEPGARFSFWLRLSSYLRSKKVLFPFFLWAWLRRRHYELKFGFSIPAQTRIGPGLFFSHFGGIVINSGAEIGCNCNVSHGVTIGQSNRNKKGVPVIGDNVFIGPGAKIFGAVRVGSRAAIGANAVVTDDVPCGAVVAGVPARVISMRGSEGYIDWTAADDADLRKET